IFLFFFYFSMETLQVSNWEFPDLLELRTPMNNNNNNNNELVQVKGLETHVANNVDTAHKISIPLEPDLFQNAIISFEDKIWAPVKSNVEYEKPKYHLRVFLQLNDEGESTSKCLDG